LKPPVNQRDKFAFKYKTTFDLIMISVPEFLTEW